MVTVRRRFPQPPAFQPLEGPLVVVNRDQLLGPAGLSGDRQHSGFAAPVGQMEPGAFAERGNGIWKLSEATKTKVQLGVKGRPEKNKGRGWVAMPITDTKGARRA